MITAQQVKELREKTGAGMMDCKEALQKASGDFARAEKILKEQGVVAASKRSGRTANEGRVFIAENDKHAIIMELSCETDFVARNEQFISLGNTLANKMLDGLSKEKQDVLITEAAALIKENIQLKRSHVMDRTANTTFTSYIHGEAGNVGSLIQLQSDDATTLQNTAVQDFAFDCALHLAAFKPQFLSPDAVPEAYVQEQREIFMAQAQKLGKPDNILTGIVEGKLQKHYNEICLLNQPFVKDDKMNVQAKIKEIMQQINGDFTIATFQVFVVGEE